MLLQTVGILWESDFLLAYLWTSCIVGEAEATSRRETNKQHAMNAAKTTAIAKQIRQVRPDITSRDAMAIARLPVARVNHLRSHGLLNRGEVASTLRKLRLLGEVA